jgi:SAM-dependent methyltransferase
LRAGERAAQLGITIDNLESLRSQVFSPSGTIHDGPGSGWNSLAIGPDGKIYPSPALVGLPELATEVQESLARAWRESPVLEKIRRVSAAALDSPFRFLLGGGDLDHSYIHSGRFLGADPYQPLQEQLALWVIAREVDSTLGSNKPGLRLKMGEVLETCGSNHGVALTHHNCLLAAAQPGSIDTVKAFYQDAAVAEKTDILNPIGYPEEFIAHIPPARRFRGYGCGSPVLEAGLQPGECVLDLGSGMGIECFIAAPLVGPTSRVYGVDMLEAMLSRARTGAAEVAANLGYDNLEFKSGYLEALPLDAGTIDVVLSNCVINLSTQKRRTFAEIFRVLRSGGRLIIADVVCDTDPPAALKNDDVLRGECLAGAMTQKDLFGLLHESGFTAIMARKRFLYRQVQGHQFYSLTYSAVKPNLARPVQVMYRGPLAGLVTEQGELLPAGVSRFLYLSSLPTDAGELFVLDSQGAVLNQVWQAPSCCPGTTGCCSPALDPELPSPALSCCAPPEAASTPVAPLPDSTEGQEKISLLTENRKPKTENFPAGCLVCGAPLTYLAQETPARCVYCQTEHPANALCQQGHFVCDACHSRDALAVIEHLLLARRETDMIALLKEIRRHPAIHLHGPEHHSLVPGIILTAYRNLGGPITPEMLQTALRRGQSIAGGACAFLGVCGAPAGLGVAFSLLLEANPVKPRERQWIKQITLEALQASAQTTGARCCQQECWLALQQAARLSGRYLPIPLNADTPLICEQWPQNKECLGTECPLWSP